MHKKHFLSNYSGNVFLHRSTEPPSVGRIKVKFAHHQQTRPVLKQHNVLQPLLHACRACCRTWQLWTVHLVHSFLLQWNGNIGWPHSSFTRVETRLSGSFHSLVTKTLKWLHTRWQKRFIGAIWHYHVSILSVNCGPWSTSLIPDSGDITRGSNPSLIISLVNTSTSTSSQLSTPFSVSIPTCDRCIKASISRNAVNRGLHMPLSGDL